MTRQQCEAKQQNTEDSPVRICDREAVGRYRSMCVHEHLRESWMCQFHRDAHSGHGVQRGPLCWECFTIDGHECPMGERVAVT